MSKSPIRKDKTCLNCNYVVEKRFCPNCGQENTDTRKTFHHLFVHFFEDLTHYENSFWKTIRNLFFKPASLTKEYLSGKRLSYLAPVRLYIFISFVTFFLISVFPNSEDEMVDMNQTKTVKIKDKDGNVKDSLISSRKIKMSELMEQQEKEFKNENVSYAKQNENLFSFGYHNLKELDSLQKYGPEEDRLGSFEYNCMKKMLIVKAKYSRKELYEKFIEAAWHNIPKALFVYMPLFALVLWLFHGKRRWYYFDHGIFTLHYFSFLLLMMLVLFFFRKLMNCFADNAITTTIGFTGRALGYLWFFYYFFPAHHRFYGESRTISLIKSIAMFIINVILITFLLVVFVVYTFITLH